jgi:photosystem II stability/assembly factor-like uncharacterized protein
MIQRYAKYFLVILFFSAMIISCRKKVALNISQVDVDSISRQNFQDIIFINSDTVFVVGGIRFSNGQMLSSFDGGSTWHLKDTMSKWILSGITHQNNNILTTGVTGNIFQSNDMGKTFTNHQTAEWSDLERIISPSDSVIIAIGSSGILQRNINGIWHAQNFKRQLCAIAFTSANIGYIAAFGAIYKTINAGRSWEILNAKGDNFCGLYFFDDVNGFAIGREGSILETSNGGKTWRTRRNGNNILNATWQFTDILFTDVSTGYICGVNGLLLKTTDGGNSWNKADYFSDLTVRRLYTFDKKTVWMVGDGGSIFKIEQ